MSTRYRLSYLVLLCLFGSIALPALTSAGTPDQRAAERGHLLRTLDLIRQGSGRMQVPAAPARAKAIQLTEGTGSITGILSGLGPEGFASASVTAWAADSSASRDGIAMAMVEPEGRYRIDGLSPGAYYVSASAKGYLPQYYKGARSLPDAVPVKVAEGETTEGIDFAMEPLGAGTGSIAGTVRLETDGRPIPGASVHVFSPDNPFLYGMAQTGEDGTYLVSGLTTGRYLVEVWASGTMPEFFDNASSPDLATQVEVVEPGQTDHIDFSLATGGSITGYVRNAEGMPVAGAYVQAYVYETMPVPMDSTGQKGEGEAVPGGPTPEGMATAPMPVAPVGQQRGGYITPSGGWAISDEAGFYRIGGLATGKYYVQAQVSSRWYYTVQWYDGALDFPEATPVAVTLDAETSGIDLALALPVMQSAISGRVTDRQGQPVAKAFIAVQDAAQWKSSPSEPVPGTAGPDAVIRASIWAYATTDQDGNYAVEELPAGTYLVSAATQSGWEYVQRWYKDAASAEEATPVTLGVEEKLANIDLILPIQAGTASLAGMVQDSHGEALAWAFVEVRPAAADPSQPVTLWAYTQTDSQGAYRVDGLPAGVYTIHASYGTGDQYGQGWYDGASTPEAAAPVALADGEARTAIDFHLAVRPLYGTVEGTITDASTGAPQVRAYVELSPVARDYLMDAPFRYFASSALTDEAGHFELTFVPEGQYSLAVYADGASAQYVDLDTKGPVSPIEVIGGEVLTRNVALSQRRDGDGVIAGTVKISYGGPVPLSSQAPAGDSSAPPAAEVIDSGKVDDASVPEVAVVLAFPLAAGEATTEAGYTAVTAPDGTYALRGLAPGDYVVMSFAPGCIGVYFDATYAPDQATPVHVDGQQPAEGIDFVLAPAYFWRIAEADGGPAGAAPASPSNSSPAAVYGKVTTLDGNAVQGATVYLLDETAQPAAYGQTGADGSFELSGVAPGAYRVYASKVGLGGTYNGNVPNFSQAEAIAMNGGHLEVNLVLSPGPVTAVEEKEEVLPQALTLLGNYPNPFNPSTQIGFAVPAGGRATVRVYNALGQQVAVLFDGVAEAARQYDLSFQAGALSAGAYVYTLEFGGQRLSRKMALVK